MTEDDNILAASYDWWSHNGSIKPMQLKIALGSGKEPAMTIHPDGKITLGENAEPTEAAAACIDAMSHMIQCIIDRAVSEERAAIGWWLRKQGLGFVGYQHLAKEIEAGEHLK